MVLLAGFVVFLTLVVLFVGGVVDLLVVVGFFAAVVVGLLTGEGAGF